MILVYMYALLKVVGCFVEFLFCGWVCLRCAYVIMGLGFAGGLLLIILGDYVTPCGCGIIVMDFSVCGIVFVLLMVRVNAIDWVWLERLFCYGFAVGL